MSVMIVFLKLPFYCFTDKKRKTKENKRKKERKQRKNKENKRQQMNEGHWYSTFLNLGEYQIWRGKIIKKEKKERWGDWTCKAAAPSTGADALGAGVSQPEARLRRRFVSGSSLLVDSSGAFSVSLGWGSLDEVAIVGVCGLWCGDVLLIVKYY
jgi:hypothetical protein